MVFMFLCALADKTHPQNSRWTENDKGCYTLCMAKKTILTGIKPTGVVHIGNYLGMIKPAIEMANESDDNSFLFIADYHALTTVRTAEQLAQWTKEVACVYLACGLNPEKTVFYRQSHIPENFELSTILMNATPKGLMDRAHAYKSAKQDGREVNMGLYTYPILMSADILAYDTNLVPVGEDQKQHCEIAGDIAKSFNAVYGSVLVVPEPKITKSVAVITGFDGRKMSKSYGNTIPLFCEEAELLKLIKKITTDSSAPTEPKPTTHLIYTLFSHFASEEQTKEFKSKFANGIGWGDAKQQLFTVMKNALRPLREKYNYYMTHYDEVEKILTDGERRARAVSSAVLSRVRKAIGVI
jgi:tryptophanyl-tRNA synthetase